MSSRDAVCPYCQHKNTRQARFCAHCGKNLGAEEVTPGLPAPSLRYAVAYLSDVGRQRENNEDTVRAWSFEFYGLRAWALLVADGMGGQRAGEVASRLAAEVVEAEIANRWRSAHPQPATADLKRWLSLIIRQANITIYRRARNNPSLRGMGTTATLAWLERDQVSVAHVGDSRAYLLPVSGPIKQITRDHTLAALLLETVHSTAEEMSVDEQGNHLLYRALGLAEHLDVDTYARSLTPGDRLLLCTDGLTHHVSDSELAAIARRHVEPATACQELVALANQRGGDDNISVIIALAQLAPA